ncbi:MAG: hypothetical protein ACP5KY_08500 [Thermoproteus sp.]
MYLLAGLYKPTSGVVEIDGKPPADLSGQERVSSSATPSRTPTRCS